MLRLFEMCFRAVLDILKKFNRSDELGDLKPAVPDLFMLQLGILLLCVAGADRGRGVA